MGPLHTYAKLIMRNLKAITATDLKPCVVILCTTLTEMSCPTHIRSGHGDRECHTCSKISCLYLAFGALPFQVRGLPYSFKRCGAYKPRKIKARGCWQIGNCQNLAINNKWSLLLIQCIYYYVTKTSLHVTYSCVYVKEHDHYNATKVLLQAQNQ